MAALDRRISILDECVGQSWNSWIDKADVSTPEAPSGEECSKNVKKRMETMTLRKEDMCIYGHCPAHDDFYLVVCSHCGQVVKPQAFEKHCERRHGPLSKLYGPHTSLSSPVPHWLHAGRPPSQHGGRPPAKHAGLHEAHEGKQQATGPPRVPPLHSPIHKAPKAHKDGTSILQLDQYPHGSPPSPPYLSMQTPRDPSWHQGSTPSKMPPPVEKVLQKGTHMPRPLHSPRTYSRTYKKVPKKECDLDKHCGVLDPERKKLCTRLLTCNIHSIHQRRQVEGRSKSFDQLVLELKMSSRARERAPLARDAPSEGFPCPQAPCEREPASQACRRQVASYVSLRSKTPSESGVEVDEWDPCSEEGDGPFSLRPPAHSASSEESDGENQEEYKDLPTSTCHPKPLGLCTFGARVLGCSVLAFDRRLFRLRSALSTMVEQHLSAHLWKKIPQVSELRSHQPASAYSSSQSAYISQDAVRSPPIRVPVPSASSIRTSTSSVPKRPPGDISTSGQLEARASSLTHPSKNLTKVPITSAISQSHNPVGLSKQALQARLRQLQESPTSRKRRRSPPEEEDSRSFSVPYPRDRQPSSTRPSLSPSHGLVNGVLLPGSKPRPQLHLSETQGLVSGHTSSPSPPESSSNDVGGASGLHRKALGHEPKGPNKKRKTSGASSLEALSRHSKPNSLSSTRTPSSLFSWRRDSKAGPVPLSMEKKPEAQKPKLHH